MNKENLRLRALGQVAGVILLAAASGFVVNQVRSRGLPLVADWSTEARLTDESGLPVEKGVEGHSDGRKG